MSKKTSDSSGKSSLGDCPKCGTKLKRYGDDGAQCPNKDCRWVTTSGYEGPAIDGTMSSGPWANDGETVDATPRKDDGKIETNGWQDKIESDPEDLTDREKRILSAVARYPNDNAPDIAKKLELDYSSLVYNAVKSLWPEKYESIKVNDPANKKFPDSEIETVRRRALNGEVASEIAEDYSFSEITISKRITGTYECKSEIPPLEYDRSNGEYYIPGDAEKPEDRGTNEAEEDNVDDVGSEKDGHESTETDNDPANKKFPDSEIETVRRRALNGEVAPEIAEDYPVSDKTIGKRLRNTYECNSEIPPLEYDKSHNEYYIPGDAEKPEDRGTNEAEKDNSEPIDAKNNTHTSFGKVETVQDAVDKTSDQEQQEKSDNVKTAIQSAILILLIWIGYRLGRMQSGGEIIDE